MKLRDAVSHDASLIAHLHTTSWRSAYQGILSAEYLQGAIEQERLNYWQEKFNRGQPNLTVIVAEDDSQAVGFVCIEGGKDPQWGSLVDNLHVLPAIKGQGFGIALLKAAARWTTQYYPAQGMHLWCYEQNLPSRRFYERCGGKVVEIKSETVPGNTALNVLRYYWERPEILLD